MVSCIMNIFPVGLKSARTAYRDIVQIVYKKCFSSFPPTKDFYSLEIDI